MRINVSLFALLLSVLGGCASRVAPRDDSGVPAPAKPKGPSAHALMLQRQLAAKEASYHETLAKVLDEVPKLAGDKALITALDTLIGQEYWQREFHALVDGASSVRTMLTDPAAERYKLRYEVSSWVGATANLIAFVQNELEEHPENAEGQNRASVFVDAVGLKLVALLPLSKKWEALGDASEELQNAQRDFAMQLALEGFDAEQLAAK